MFNLLTWHLKSNNGIVFIIHFKSQSKLGKFTITFPQVQSLSSREKDSQYASLHVQLMQ